MTQRDGGSAFPNTEAYFEPPATIHSGMSLRDWFAGQALAGMVNDHGDDCDGYRAAVTRRAYAVADAMLAEREKKS